MVVLRFWGPLTTLARGYFLIEATIVLLLVRYEFATLREPAAEA